MNGQTHSIKYNLLRILIAYKFRHRSVFFREFFRSMECKCVVSGGAEIYRLRLDHFSSGHEDRADQVLTWTWNGCRTIWYHNIVVMLYLSVASSYFRTLILQSFQCR